MDALILAHDLGTSGNKATLFSEDGVLLASRTYPYSTDFRPGGVAEQNPEDWWTAVCESTRALMDAYRPEQVRAIAFSGMMMGCLCVDQDGRPLRPHMLYCDQRAEKQTRRLIREASAETVYRLSGSPASPVNSGAKCMWVRDHEPDIYAQTHAFLNAKDYLNFRLTGRMATDPTDASGTNLYDLEQWNWSDELIAAAGLDRDKFPEIVPSASILGGLTPDAARDLGLPPGIPVAAGAADGVCAAVGAGSIAPGRAYACLGSSAWAGITTDRPYFDPKMRTIVFAHAVPGLYQPLGTMLAAGSAYAWAADVLGIRELAAATISDYHSIMTDKAAASPPGANGLLFLPHLMGERTPRWNPEARAGFVGLSMTHSQCDMIRAVMEGVVFNLSLTVDILRELGLPIMELTILGGAAKGSLWRRILADILDARIQRSNVPEEATSVGAAILAGIGAGLYRDFSETGDFVREGDITKPDPDNAARYRELQALFDETYTALEPLFPRYV